MDGTLSLPPLNHSLTLSLTPGLFMVPRSHHATTTQTRRRTAYGSASGSASGLRVAVHVRGEERTNSRSLSVHALTFTIGLPLEVFISVWFGFSQLES